MRSAVDLLDLPFGFAQLRPLMADDFRRQANDRGVSLQQAHLEALHRARILVPLFRVIRDTRTINALARRGARETYSFSRWHPTSRFDLEQARGRDWLRDPAEERFMSIAQRRRPLEDYSYEASVYVYSPHQLITLPLVKETLASMKYSRGGDDFVATLQARRFWMNAWRERGERMRELVIALTALEPAYYSQVTGRLSLSREHEFADLFEWRRKLPVTAMLKWLEVDAAWVKDAGAELLRVADGFDPLRDWVELLAEAHFDKWNRLRGNARSALDVRIAAEVFLRYYDDLAASRRAKALPKAVGRFRGAFDTRLKRSKPLDEVLTEFGLSPHPDLVLMVEGETELLLFPRVMEHFGVRTDEDFISVQMAGGVRRDLSSLIAYAVSPRVQPEERGKHTKYLKLVRPPTRILVVFDAEPPVATTADREKRRSNWVKRIMLAMPREIRHDVAGAERVREQVDGLVDLITWNRRGDSFEFAHFTDRQISAAIDRLDPGPRKPDLATLITRVAGIRERHANLDEVLHRVSKVDLADALWPTLESKIKAAVRRKTDGRIPVVQVLDEALRLAHEYPRRNLVLSLDET